jgi:hypothetical protein
MHIVCFGSGSTKGQFKLLELRSGEVMQAHNKAIFDALNCFWGQGLLWGTFYELGEKVQSPKSCKCPPLLLPSLLLLPPLLLLPCCVILPLPATPRLVHMPLPLLRIHPCSLQRRYRGIQQQKRHVKSTTGFGFRS